MVMSKINLLFAVVTLAFLSACAESYDLQGHDPQEYYAAHPIENKVETRHSLFPVSFVGYSTTLSASDGEVLRDLKNINPSAVEAITLQAGSKMAYKKQRVQHIKKLLGKYNLPVKVITQEKISANKIVVDITHAVVVAPDCPDWKKSPVTTYSNMTPANFACASTVNLGLMVDNPRDLVRGQDSREHRAERSAKVLSDYHSGIEPTSSATATSSATGQ